MRLTRTVIVNVDSQRPHISSVEEQSGENVRETTRGNRGVHRDYFEPTARTKTVLRLSRIHHSTKLDS